MQLKIELDDMLSNFNRNMKDKNKIEYMIEDDYAILFQTKDQTKQIRFCRMGVGSWTTVFPSDKKQIEDKTGVHVPALQQEEINPYFVEEDGGRIYIVFPYNGFLFEDFSKEVKKLFDFFV